LFYFSTLYIGFNSSTEKTVDRHFLSALLTNMSIVLSTAPC